MFLKRQLEVSLSPNTVDLLAAAIRHLLQQPSVPQLTPPTDRGRGVGGGGAAGHRLSSRQRVETAVILKAWWRRVGALPGEILGQIFISRRLCAVYLFIYFSHLAAALDTSALPPCSLPHAKYLRQISACSCSTGVLEKKKKKQTNSFALAENFFKLTL